MKLIEIIDLEFLINPDYEDGPFISGQSKSLNISCHVMLSDELLKEKGLEYIQQLCQGIKENMAYQYQNGLIE